MVDDYQFSSKAADFRTLSVCAKRLFTVFWDVRIKRVIILNVVLALFEDLLVCYVTSYEGIQKFKSLLGDISIRFIQRNCLVLAQSPQQNSHYS